MLHEFLRKTAQRHFHETKLLVDQLDDRFLVSEPAQKGRSFGEIFLHMIRSIEYYLRGLITDVWEALPYNLQDYNSANAIKTLYEEVIRKAEDYLEQLTPDIALKIHHEFNRSATEAEILLEMIEHSIHHRGQITVYYRLLGSEPPSISYII